MAIELHNIISGIHDLYLVNIQVFYFLRLWFVRRESTSPPTSLWKGKGRVRRRPRFWVGWGIIGRAHIPQKRGGAPDHVDARAWERVVVVRAKVVVVRWEENQPWWGWWRIKTPLTLQDSVRYER